jgi:3-dehydroquinate dehydratase-1
LGGPPPAGPVHFESFVLAAATTDLADERAARAHADAVEFRMDGAADPLASLRDYDGALPVMATNRARWEGGAAGGDAPGAAGERERLDALAAAAGTEAVAAVDVELRAVEDGAGERVLAAAREAGVATLVSVHDFEGTPPEWELRDLLARAADAGDVGKLAVTAAGPDDALSVLSATRAATEAGDRVATMAMGEAGRHTRAVAPLYGSRVGYAPVDPGEATAPGQYDLATLADLLAALGVDRR